MNSHTEQEKTEEFNNRTLRQFILNEQPDNLTEATGNSQLGVFAGLFGGLIHGISTVGKDAVFPLLMLFTLIKEGFAWQHFRKNKNRTAHSWLDRLLNTTLFTAEVTAVVFTLTTLVALPILAPLIFVISLGIRWTKNLLDVLYHGYQLFNNRKENYTKEYAYQKQAFLNSLKELAITTTIVAGVIAIFFLPVAFPALVAALMKPTIIFGIKTAVCGILGVFCVHGLGKMAYNKVANKQENIQTQQYQQLQEQNDSEEKQNLISNKLDQNTQEKYRKNQKLYDLTNSHIDDLLIKMELLSSQERIVFLNRLLATEEELITDKNSLKYEVFCQLKALVEEKDQQPFNSVRELTLHYKNQLNKVFTSLLAKHDIGRLQKLFIVVDHYFEIEVERTNDSHCSQLLCEEEEEKENNNPITTTRFNSLLKSTSALKLCDDDKDSTKTFNFKPKVASPRQKLSLFKNEENIQKTSLLRRHSAPSLTQLSSGMTLVK